VIHPVGHELPILGMASVFVSSPTTLAPALTPPGRAAAVLGQRHLLRQLHEAGYGGRLRAMDAAMSAEGPLTKLTFHAAMEQMQTENRGGKMFLTTDDRAINLDHVREITWRRPKTGPNETVFHFTNGERETAHGIHEPPGLVIPAGFPDFLFSQTDNLIRRCCRLDECQRDLGLKENGKHCKWNRAAAIAMEAFVEKLTPPRVLKQRQILGA
jgi:hypothetical protein